MRKVYSIMMMLAMMVAAVSFTACSGDEEDDGPNGKMTLKIDGESYYCGELSSVEQTQRNGMYIEVEAVTDLQFQIKGE